MFTLDGINLPLDVPFTHNDIQYPANWLRLALPEERAAIGIVDLTLAEQPTTDTIVSNEGVA